MFKPTNSFTYVLPSTCYPMKNINEVPQGIALRLRRICDTTEKYKSRADEYKNYLLARDYKPSLVDEQFKKISKISREDARKSKPKTNQVNKIKFVTKYNPRLPKIDGIIKNIFQFCTMMMHSKLSFLKTALVPFIKEIKI